MQRLNEENAALKAENAALKAENAALKAENAALKAEDAASKAQITALVAQNAALATSVTVQSAPARDDTRAHSASLEFRGNCVIGQEFFFSSFPGMYESEWKIATEGDGGAAPAGSVSCVFFPSTSDLFGKHSTPCVCAKLYGDKGATPHPEFHTWKDGKAAWGCFWFGTWQNKTKECIALKQKAVVIYKRGCCGDHSSAGLGHSQKGEVNWLIENDIPFAQFDIDQFDELVACAREKRDGAAAYWDQVGVLFARRLLNTYS